MFDRSPTLVRAAPQLAIRSRRPPSHPAGSRALQRLGTRVIFIRGFISCFVFPLLKGQEALPDVPAAEPRGLPSLVPRTGAEQLVQVTTLLLIQHHGSPSRTQLLALWYNPASSSFTSGLLEFAVGEENVH